ncbi:xanthine dehydrogenase family protein molybdopterin-binding subunit [Acuticoccus sp. MNP-M23]|uniref:xanthine dehydrogenase family protein molybdopterin-binding subunit n=1 Tax=Acuticoccus sp. MNP-M23 TaxID=3072793 RepID=UPI002816148B|nr:xanthine dehydrogenase family protein molybdopterin-binding subunit [Acuticoccus sp. MNP-M23]WMS41144.1 xanthine dehydrogenase family protein molybdopterin-binding subunit [Acuticoccus sp. MNP-M23]
MNDMTMAKFGVGARALRVEDKKFITGHGKYSDDFQPEGCLVAVFLRSPIAAGTFTINDTAAAKGAPGVHAVFTHDDLADLKPLPCRAALEQADGSATNVPPRPALANGRVHHVGVPVAMVVAETVEQANDAAELIEVDWDSEPAVAGTAEALEDGAPLVWPDHGSNLAFLYAQGNKDATEEAFAKAAKTAKVELINNRVVANYMETRTCLAEYENGRYRLTAGTQGGHGMIDVLAEILQEKEENIHVVTPDVGGGFGTKIFVYNEYPMVMKAAKDLGRPVKWVCGRSESFMCDSQGRDNVTVAEVAMDDNGKFTALRVDLKANMGGYLAQFGPFIPWVGTTMAPGVYAIPVMYVAIKGVFTNTVPVDAYRGAGRPEAAYTIERLVDEAARVTGIDRLELRRRNFITQEQMPFLTAADRTYDTGDFNGHMTRALEVAEYDTFRTRDEESAASGKFRGIGVATYIEACAFPGSEKAEVILKDDGKFQLLIGTQSNGQGHATAYAQVIAEKLGVDISEVDMIQGDTDIVKTGGGTGGSRSIPLGMPSVAAATDELSQKMKDLASDHLEAAAADLEFDAGSIRVVGTDKAVSFSELAAKAPGTSGSGDVSHAEPTFPNGTHIAEVEIDPATGITEVLRYTIVDDFGVTVNPNLLAGQVHGGVVQGIGQALLENTVYDEDGQLITASLLDYCVARADDVPSLYFETRNIPSKHNAMGIKGAGEAGSIGSCPAIMNAVIDAMWRNVGVSDINMPATPGVLWKAINDARRQAAE